MATDAREEGGAQPPPSDYGLAIFPNHAALLRASAISVEVARARGYVSVDVKTRLEQAGFSKTQRRPPGLLIPWRGVTGEIVTYEYRPDEPRVTDAGRVLKYEKPTGAQNRLDVPPSVNGQLTDPSIELWVAEGAKKVDAGISAGICCVGIAGVYGWRYTDKSTNGKAALGDWESVALNGRAVVLCFDADLKTNKQVRGALDRFRRFLESRGAHVRLAVLPDLGDGKSGLDDYLAAGHTVEELRGCVVDAVPFTPPDSRATAQHPPPAPTEPPAIAYAARILDLFRDEVRLRGLVGEERNAATLYLVVTSRLLDRQVSAGLKGHSSSGKSYTVDTVLKFFPDDAVIEFTAFSERALVFSKRDYRHKTVVIYEVVALREGNDDNLTSYFVRSLLSEGRIVYEQTVRDTEGPGFTTKLIIKEGPTNLIFTTTKTSVHAENETRVLSLNTDDSKEQTARVFVELANESTANRDLSEWIELQRWLAGAAHRVTIPFAPELAQRIPPAAVRLRRDVGAVLALIRAHAVLHQATRERDAHRQIIATLDDYDAVRELVAEVIAAGVEATVPSVVRETVAAVDTLFIDYGDDKRNGVTAGAVAKHLDVDKSNASRRLRRAADAGFIQNLEGKRGRAARWVIGDSMPEDVELLPDLRISATPRAPSDQECCAVAPDLGGIDGTAAPHDVSLSQCSRCGAEPVFMAWEGERLCRSCWHEEEPV
jgi:hypothetical protein